MPHCAAFKQTALPVSLHAVESGLKGIIPIHVSYVHPQLHEEQKHCNI